MQNLQTRRIVYWILLVLFWISTCVIAIYASIYWFQDYETPMGVLLIVPSILLVLYFSLYFSKVLKSHKRLVLFQAGTLFATLIPLFPAIMTITAGGYPWIDFIGSLIVSPFAIVSLIISSLIVKLEIQEEQNELLT